MIRFNKSPLLIDALVSIFLSSKHTRTQQVVSLRIPKWSVGENVYEHAQYAQIRIILRMHKVSSGHLLSIHTLHPSSDSVSGQWRPSQTARIQRLIWTFVVCICPKTRFRMALPTWLTIPCEMPNVFAIIFTLVRLSQYTQYHAFYISLSVETFGHPA